MSRTTKSHPSKRLIGALIAAVVGITTLGISSPASAATAPVGLGSAQEIRNQHSSMCLDDFDFGTQPGAEVRQWSCTEGSNQRWQVTDLGTGYAEIKNTFSNLCLDNFDFGTTPGSEVRQWSCNGSTAQQWRITSVGGGYAEIANRHSDLCLDNNDFRQLDGSPIQQWTCTGSKAQRWALTDPTVQKITWTLNRVASPTADEADAYARITDAMDRAVARYNRLSNISRSLTVSYSPGTPTADANIYGQIRFGKERVYMVEGTAMHEISHTVGLGTSTTFNTNCENSSWDSALALLRTWDGPDATIQCTPGHILNYGLNYNSEFSQLNLDRHVKLVQSMLSDGM
ncbi:MULTISPECIES: RICIN domain-containing protein [unclassified Rathayibacter]|jgi:hypothetical protein|uniref:RICIN domain-containing protein n=1 Tax=unclassified Rathayibacter TaxID=2609250 RepID=UPI000CE8C325|nr:MULTISPECIES: RICIN domain-containing protein [unclassified Rathayibacter]PPF45690.1 hypothetical protein C5E14_12110 [Rathayibacter sp. AY1A1]PPG86421.1 hypothetical protein C5C29_03525 [Rathayibacter sp. AY1H2]PPG99342.1 hypothetical protein C5C32_12315 [Rathayibacter sp. AY1G9]